MNRRSKKDIERWSDGRWMLGKRKGDRYKRGRSEVEVDARMREE